MAARLGTRGREASLLYDWSRIAEQVLDLYVKTADRSFTEYTPVSVTAPNPLI